MRATQDLRANIAAEHRAMHEFYATWHAIVTPHQDIRGELAAWPYGVSELRLIKMLGACRCPITGANPVADPYHHSFALILSSTLYDISNCISPAVPHHLLFQHTLRL